MDRDTVIVCLLIFALSACGYGREEDKEMKRKEDLQELSQEMSSSLTNLSTLKIQLRDSLSYYSGQEDSLSKVKVDRYRLLKSELEQAEKAYEDWQEEIEFEPSNMSHEEAMEYYDMEEDKAEVLRQDMQKTVEYVQSEMKK